LDEDRSHGDHKLVVGLTGGIGSGKSTMAAMFAEFGASVIDADVIAHMLTQPDGAAMQFIIGVFGRSYADSHGGLDRGAMRTLVFSDPQAKRQLEGILHPMILDCANEQLARVDGAYNVLVVPLLIESSAYRKRVDRIVVVDCDEKTQTTRTMARSGMGEDAVRAIINSQASREDRLAAAHDVIDNDGDLARLKTRVELLHRRYLVLAKQKAEKCSK
jgi:dephospho-CoA kinase